MPVSTAYPVRQAPGGQPSYRSAGDRSGIEERRVELADKVVIVTGGSSGIGAATARRAAEEGAKVVLAARRTDRIEALAAELPGALAVTTDVRDPEQVRALVQVTLDRHGRVDVLVNYAGQGLHVP